LEGRPDANQRPAASYPTDHLQAGPDHNGALGDDPARRFGYLTQGRGQLLVGADEATETLVPGTVNMNHDRRGGWCDPAHQGRIHHGFDSRACPLGAGGVGGDQREPDVTGALFGRVDR
jgi:hypothetical protein